MLYESTYYGIAGLGDDSLQHHGIKGQKWGVRRYQNPDGTLTALGKQRYKTASREGLQRAYKRYIDADNAVRKSQNNYEEKIQKKMNDYAVNKYGKTIDQLYDISEKEDWSYVDSLRYGDYEKYRSAYQKQYATSAYKKLEDIDNEGYELRERFPDRETEKRISARNKVAKDYLENYINENGTLKYSDLTKLSKGYENPEHPGYKTYREADTMFDAIDALDFSKYEISYDGGEITVRKR